MTSPDRRLRPRFLSGALLFVLPFLLLGPAACRDTSSDGLTNSGGSGIGVNSGGSDVAEEGAGAGAGGTLAQDGNAASTVTAAQAAAIAAAAAAADAKAEQAYGDGRALPSEGNVDFGSNVYLFDATTAPATLQAQLDAAFKKQESNQFGDERYAFLLTPGTYNLDVNLGFYTTVMGLGTKPDDVQINGAVRVKAKWFSGNATQNFWRGAENFALTPTLEDGVNVWAVAQATTLRRAHIKGKLVLWETEWNGVGNNWSSGGFMADSAIDGTITSGSQQQFFTRNTNLGFWDGGVWNMVFVGDNQTPTPSWPTPPFTTVNAKPFTAVAATPTVREKPYLTWTAAAGYAVQVPNLRLNSVGPTWQVQTTPGRTLALSTFYVAKPEADSAVTLNVALSRGKHLLLTPGIYHLTSPLRVTNPNMVILGLGMATLSPSKGNVAMTVADVDGVSIAGVLFDAGSTISPSMLQVGSQKTSVRHNVNPTALFDVACRVGGARAGSADNCLEVHSNDVQLDNIWLWRADHGAGVGWDVNPARNGIIVAGDYVNAYGLFVEHFKEYQTLWRGESGRTYFYQSEIPYDVPNQSRWMAGNSNGWASYKVDAAVKKHEARGMGVYCVFYNNVALDNAIESPTGSDITFQHMTMQWLGVDPNSSMRHLYNGSGTAVDSNHMGFFSDP